jgi:drug/metabolite transporter (DMT)-like permease
VLFGASAPAASQLAGDVPTLVLAGLLYLGAALAVVPFALRRPPHLDDVRAGWRPLALAVCFGGALGPALLVAGLAQVPAATASLLLNLELVATVVLAATLFREHLGRRLVAAAALITVAGGLLVLEPGVGIHPGALLIVAACACWGVDNSVTARIDRLAPQHVTLAKGVIAGGVNLCLGLVIAGGWGVSGRDLFAALVIGAVGYGASITLWVTGARDLGAARGQIIFAAAPFIGALLSWTLLAEQVTWLQLVSIPLAVAGVALSLRTGHEHDHRHARALHEHEHTHDDGHHDHVHAGVDGGRHTHAHEHRQLVHSHSHVPDLHHHHDH